MPSAVPPLLEALRLPTRQVRANTLGRYPAPCNGGDTGGAYFLNPFKFRTTTRESIQLPARCQASTAPDSLIRTLSGAYSFRSSSLRYSIAANLPAAGSYVKRSGQRAQPRVPTPLILESCVSINDQ
jgi:hypothetical protein